MKKLLLIPALVGTLAFAADYNYEITPLIGYNIAEGNLNLDNDVLVGLEAQYNGFDSAIKPELSILHSGGVKSENLPAGDTTSANKTNITRFALNGVYEFAESGITPFAKAGVGYETMSRQVTNNSDGAFVTTGAGVKIPFTEALALKLEALYMLKYNDNSAGGNWGDSNLAVLAGLNYSFGEKAQPVAPEPVALAPEPVDGDDDKDGVLNSMDKCPTSPSGSAVNPEGCPIIINLHLTFEHNSYEVDDASTANIEAFAEFLNNFPAYSANIIGHTNNLGSEDYNLQLSQSRANAVKDLLVEKGVSADKLRASGEGEASPVASNDTKEGRAQNRRIEAELIKD